MSSKIIGFDFESETTKALNKSGKPILSEEDLKVMENELAVAIVGKDAAKAKNVFEQGFKMGNRINGKRSSQLAMENFDWDVMDVLIENGMKMAYITSLAKIAGSHPSEDAIKYLNEKHKKIMTAKSWETAMLGAVSGKNHDVCVYIIKNHGMALKPWHHYERKTLLMMGISEKIDVLVSASLEKTSTNNSSRDIVLLKTLEMYNLTYDDCKYLQHLVNTSKKVKDEFKNYFPATAHEYIPYDMTAIISDGYFIFQEKENKKTQQQHILSEGVGYSGVIGATFSKAELKDFMDFLIFYSKGALMDILNTKKGPEIINEKIKNPGIFTAFLKKSNADMKKEALEKLPAIQTFKDSNGNNIAHYMLAANPT